MTRGRAASSDPFDLSALRHSGALLDALSARRHVDPEGGVCDADDPAVRLLASLIADVDAGAPPLPTPAHPSERSYRRVIQALVTLGMTAVVLTTAGAAAAVGGFATLAAGPHAAPDKSSERSNIAEAGRIAAGRAGRRRGARLRVGAAVTGPVAPGGLGAR